MPSVRLSDRCRLCGDPAAVVAFNLPRSPGNISRMLRPEELGLVTTRDLEVVECPRCTFVQLFEGLGESFYDDYLMTATHSPQMRQFQREQAASFAERYGLGGRRVLEVGCGDGAYLDALSEAGIEPTGIEPSRRFREEAQRRPYPVVGGYVGRGTRIAGGPFDGFVTRQVLEHVPDIHDFLTGIRENLTEDGVGLVEVPSLEQAESGRRFYDFFADHLNYFSAHTLRLALELNGFVVDAVERGMGGEYLVAWVRVAPRPALRDIAQAATDITEDLRALVEPARAAGRRVAVWGAGGKGVSTLAIAGLSGISYVVDSDPHKHGRLTPVTHAPIVPPDTLRDDPPDVLIVTALAYRDEVLRQIRELGYQGELHMLGPRLTRVSIDA